jgi:hypothetical protein
MKSIERRRHLSVKKQCEGERSMRNNILLTCIVAVCIVAGSSSLTVALASPVNEKFSLSTQFDYNANKYEAGSWVLKFSPADTSTRAWGLVSAPGYSSIDHTDGVVQSSLGSNAAAATINIYTGSSTGIDLTGKVKLNMADKSKVLGLSQNDYAAQMDVYQSLEKFTAKGSLGSKVLGNPTGIILNPVLYGSFGGVYQLSGQTSTGVDMNLSQDPFSNGTAQHELTAYVSYKLDKNLKARGYLLKGFSNNNPNTSLGGQVYYGF